MGRIDVRHVAYSSLESRVSEFCEWCTRDCTRCSRVNVVDVALCSEKDTDIQENGCRESDVPALRFSRFCVDGGWLLRKRRRLLPHRSKLPLSGVEAVDDASICHKVSIRSIYTNVIQDTTSIQKARGPREPSLGVCNDLPSSFILIKTDLPRPTPRQPQHNVEHTTNNHDSRGHRQNCRRWCLLSPSRSNGNQNVGTREDLCGVRVDRPNSSKSRQNEAQCWDAAH